VLLPFIKYIVKISEYIIKPKEHETELRFVYIDRKLTSNMLAVVPQIRKETERMAMLARKNNRYRKRGLFEYGHLARA
jgi:phosphate:Na+ symporter